MPAAYYRWHKSQLVRPRLRGHWKPVPCVSQGSVWNLSALVMLLLMDVAEYYRWHLVSRWVATQGSFRGRLGGSDGDDRPPWERLRTWWQGLAGREQSSSRSWLALASLRLSPLWKEFWATRSNSSLKDSLWTALQIALTAWSTTMGNRKDLGGCDTISRESCSFL